MVLPVLLVPRELDIHHRPVGPAPSRHPLPDLDPDVVQPLDVPPGVDAETPRAAMGAAEEVAEAAGQGEPDGGGLRGQDAGEAVRHGVGDVLHGDVGNRGLLRWLRRQSVMGPIGRLRWQRIMGLIGRLLRGPIIRPRGVLGENLRFLDQEARVVSADANVVALGLPPGNVPQHFAVTLAWRRHLYTQLFLLDGYEEFLGEIDGVWVEHSHRDGDGLPRSHACRIYIQSDDEQVHRVNLECPAEVCGPNLVTPLVTPADREVDLDSAPRVHGNLPLVLELPGDPEAQGVVDGLIQEILQSDEDPHGLPRSDLGAVQPEVEDTYAIIWIRLRRHEISRFTEQVCLQTVSIRG